MNFLKHLILGAMFLTAGNVVGQSTTPGNVAFLNTDFLGWNTNAANSFPLVVKHELNQPIEWYTDDLRRMFLHQTLTGQTVNGYAGVDLSGNLGIGLFNATTGSGPITRPLTLLHLDNCGSEDAGFRDWMRTGVTMSHISDMMYVGLKQDTAEVNTAAIVWSDNNQGGTIGPDRLRFIFTRSPAGGAVAASDAGLEIARMIPAANANEGFVGIGDWQSVGWNANPTERLDVLDGRVRIRQLPDDDEADAAFDVMVVDVSNDPNERGVVKRIEAGDLLDQDCEWTMNATAPNHVYTAFGPVDTDCPDEEEAVGIGVDLGTASPLAKLTVANDAFDHGIGLKLTTVTSETRGFDVSVTGGSTFNYGAYIDVSGTTGRSRGIHVQTTGATVTGYAADLICRDEAVSTHGVAGSTYNGTNDSYGVQGISYASAVENFGVFGRARASSADDGTNFTGVAGYAGKLGTGQNAYGIYGSADTTGSSWAGYFMGKVHITGVASCTNMVWGSDAGIKTDVEDVSNALDLIGQLRPRTYHFLSAEHPAMGLPGGLQRGLIAQEVEEVLPDIVSDVHIAPVLDSAGVIVHPGEMVKGVNYVALIPMLIAGMQEQQAVIAGLQEQLAQVQAQVSACCAMPPDGAGARSSAVEEDQDTGAHGVRLLTIAPNPFTDHTTVSYTLEHGGRAMLLVNSSDGKQLQVLEDGRRSAGQYQHVWHTSHLAPGIYYVTLLLDGEPLVKRAVKVQ